MPARLTISRASNSKNLIGWSVGGGDRGVRIELLRASARVSDALPEPASGACAYPRARAAGTLHRRRWFRLARRALRARTRARRAAEMPYRIDMVIWVKTTVDIADGLLAEAKERASAEGTTL